MIFKKLSLEDKSVLEQNITENDGRICDRTVGGIIMWRDYFGTEYAVEDGVLYLKVNYLDGNTEFVVPFGSDSKEAYERISDYCEEKGLEMRICAVTNEHLAAIKEYYPNSVSYEMRDWFDYLYLSEDMINFAGRKFSGQRNHINKFKRLYENWSFEPIDRSNVEEAKRFFIDMTKDDEESQTTLIEGDRKAIEVMDNLDLYGFCGGMLRVGENVVGISFGEIMNDTLYVHIEKCSREYEGSYQMLVNQFARMYATDGVTYINREEDDGSPGLRQSKLSYQPVKLLEKHSVKVIK